MLDRYVSKTSKSKHMHKKAKQVLPSGVSYFLRYFDPYPFYTAMAKGSKIVDVDGNDYIDFWLGHYALILGHSPPEIVNAVRQQIENGTHYGTCHELEITMADQVVKMIPSAEMIRFTNSGTEAAMYATRLARTYTNREKIAKVEGGWHGGYDALHIAVSPPLDVPQSNGITKGAQEDTIVIPFNDLEEARNKLKKYNIAAIIVEPVLGAGGGVPADKEFLKGLRELCSEKGALLIFDEIVTGFRLAPGGAQQYYGILPDITILGKIMGGGFPIGVIASRREIMEYMDPLLYERPEFSFHGGTFCGNPVSLTAGLTTLKLLEDGHLQDQLNRQGDRIRQQLHDIFEKGKIDIYITGVSSIFQTHFTREEVRDVRSAFQADRTKLMDYHMYLIANGVFFLPTKIGVLSRAHTKKDVNKFLLETENYVKRSQPDF